MGTKPQNTFLEMDLKSGGARRDRTADLLHAMQALSQLSYGPTGLERRAFCGTFSEASSTRFDPRADRHRRRRPQRCHAMPLLGQVLQPFAEKGVHPQAMVEDALQ